MSVTMYFYDLCDDCGHGNDLPAICAAENRTDDLRRCVMDLMKTNRE
jgi:hypothetical protein